MANALNDRTWVVDTVDADVIADNFMIVKSVRWVAGLNSVANDALIVRDPVTNTTLWEATASGANFTEESLYDHPITWRNGFEVPTLARGILYIQME